MLEHAWEQGVPMRSLTGDSVYGDSPDLRAAIQAHGCWYVLALTSVIRCWLEPPPLEEPQEETGGRPRRAVRLAKGAPKAQPVAEVSARLQRRAVEAPKESSGNNPCKTRVKMLDYEV
jgi:SRSO17 transposase